MGIFDHFATYRTNRRTEQIQNSYTGKHTRNISYAKGVVKWRICRLEVIFAKKCGKTEQNVEKRTADLVENSGYWSSQEMVSDANFQKYPFIIIVDVTN